MKTARIFLTVAGLVLCACSALWAQYEPAPFWSEPREYISSFDSTVEVREDGVLEVTETIRVQSSGDQIRHGIYRDFPTQYRDRYGRTYDVGFSVKRVFRNGRQEPFHLASQVNGRRVYIGDKDAELPPGDHEYMIEYETTRQVGFFKDFDELYWNVTGNGWAFPIRRASVEIVLPLPRPGMVISRVGYTGRQGERGGDYTVTEDSLGRIRFESTRPLNPQEGLTVAVSWPKGYVQEPTPAQRMRYMLQDFRGPIAGGATVLVVLVYYLAVWSFFGRDPQKGTIIPLFSPPKDVSPAAARFLMQMGFDKKVFSSAVINLAVKKQVRIVEENRVYTLEKRPAGGTALSAEEQEAMAELFRHGQSLELKNHNHQVIGWALTKVRKTLEAAYEKNYFFANTGYFVSGAAISLAGLLATIVSMAGAMSAVVVFLCVWLTIWSFGVGALASNLFSQWQRVLRGGASVSIAERGLAVFLVFFSLPFFAAEIVVVVIVSKMIGAAFIPFLALIVGINFLFYHLLKAPTHLGRMQMDALEGFRMYLAAAEKDRLNLLNPPEETPELFERYLPYAFALDVEQQWCDRFTQVLAAAQAQGKEYRPDWYSGHLTTAGLAGGFSSIGNSFSSAISSSAHAPGSSSGSGGGGSSGGGGGGGGGGGW